MPKKHNPIKKAEQPLKKGDEKQIRTKMKEYFILLKK